MINEAEFNSYVVELLAFRAKCGTDRVPTRESKLLLHKLRECELAEWVAEMNKRRKRVDPETGAPDLPHSHVEVLCQAGFPWEQNWEDYYEKLVAFWKEHGHSNVVRRGSALGGWVTDQRKAYKRRAEGKGSSMTQTKIELLESVDFKWRLKESKDQCWTDCYRRLLRYRQEHSDCNVPRKYAPDQSLANWVAKQRHWYKKRKNEGDVSYMTDERVKKLDEVNFKWFVNMTKRKDVATNVTIPAVLKYEEDTGVPARQLCFE